MDKVNLAFFQYIIPIYSKTSLQYIICYIEPVSKAEHDVSNVKVVLDERFSPPLNTAGEQAKLLPRED